MSLIVSYILDEMLRKRNVSEIMAGVYGLVSAAKVDDLKEKYPELAEQIQQLNDEDPTPTKKYLAWGTSILRSGEVALGEVLDLMRRYHEAYPRLKGDARDINKLKTAEAVKKVLTTDSGNRAGRLKKKADENADYLWENDRFVLLYPKTKEAACYHGGGTGWCISVRDADYLAGYNEDGEHIYFLIDREASKDMEKRKATENHPHAKIALLFSDEAPNEFTKAYDTHDGRMTLDKVKRIVEERWNNELPLQKLMELMQADANRRGYTVAHRAALVEWQGPDFGKERVTKATPAEVEASIRAGLITAAIATNFYSLYDKAAFPEDITKAVLQFDLSKRDGKRLGAVKEKKQEILDILYPLLIKDLDKAVESDPTLSRYPTVWASYYAGDDRLEEMALNHHHYGLDILLSKMSYGGEDVSGFLQDNKIPFNQLADNTTIRMQSSVVRHIVNEIIAGKVSDEDLISSMSRSGYLASALEMIAQTDNTTAWKMVQSLFEAAVRSAEPPTETYETVFTEYYLKNASLDELKAVFSMPDSPWQKYFNASIVLFTSRKEVLLGPGMAEALSGMVVFGNHYLTYDEKLDFADRSGANKALTVAGATKLLRGLSTNSSDSWDDELKDLFNRLTQVQPGPAGDPHERMRELVKNPEQYHNVDLQRAANTLAGMLSKAGFEDEALLAASTTNSGGWAHKQTEILPFAEPGSKLSNLLLEHAMATAIANESYYQLNFKRPAGTPLIPHIQAADKDLLKRYWPSLVKLLVDEYKLSKELNDIPLEEGLYDWMMVKAPILSIVAQRIDKVEFNDDGSTATVLTAAKVDDLVKSDPELEVQIRELNEADPTPTKKYLVWGVKQLRAGEALESVLDAVQKHHKAAPRLPAELRDINKLRTLADVKDAVMSDKGNRAIRLKHKADRNAVYLYNDDNYTLLRLKNKQAACYHGMGTAWCISVKASNYFYSYSEQGNHIYMVVDKQFTDVDKRNSNQNDKWAKVAFLVRDEDPHPVGLIYNTHDKEITRDAAADHYGRKLLAQWFSLMKQDAAQAGITFEKRLARNLESVKTSEIEEVVLADSASLTAMLVVFERMRAGEDVSTKVWQLCLRNVALSSYGAHANDLLSEILEIKKVQPEVANEMADYYKTILLEKAASEPDFYVSDRLFRLYDPQSNKDFLVSLLKGNSAFPRLLLSLKEDEALSLLQNNFDELETPELINTVTMNKNLRPNISIYVGNRLVEEWLDGRVDIGDEYIEGFAQVFLNEKIAFDNEKRTKFALHCLNFQPTRDISAKYLIKQGKDTILELINRPIQLRIPWGELLNNWLADKDVVAALRENGFLTPRLVIQAVAHWSTSMKKLLELVSTLNLRRSGLIENILEFRLNEGLGSQEDHHAVVDWYLEEKASDRDDEFYQLLMTLYKVVDATNVADEAHKLRMIEAFKDPEFDAVTNDVGGYVRKQIREIIANPEYSKTLELPEIRAWVDVIFHFMKKLFSQKSFSGPEVMKVLREAFSKEELRKYVNETTDILNQKLGLPEGKDRDTMFSLIAPVLEDITKALDGKDSVAASMKRVDQLVAAAFL